MMRTLPVGLQNWVADHLHPRPVESEAPLRAELFSVEQLASHAKALASHHKVVTHQGSNCLLARLGQNEEILRAFNRATLAIGENRKVTPAAEWLLDNFHLIEEQIFRWVFKPLLMILPLLNLQRLGWPHTVYLPESLVLSLNLKM